MSEHDNTDMGLIAGMSQQQRAANGQEYSISLPWPHPPSYYKNYGDIDGTGERSGEVNSDLDAPPVPPGSNYQVFGALDSVSGLPIVAP